MTVGPELAKALLRWIVFIMLLSGVGILAAKPGTPAFVLSVVMLGFAAVFGAVLLVVVRLLARRP